MTEQRRFNFLFKFCSCSRREAIFVGGVRAIGFEGDRVPEGPEIRRAADTIAKVLKGREATKVSFAFPHLQPFESELSGQTITAVESRGKGMLIHFQDGPSIYSHNQLYGRWVTTKSDEPPKTNRQIRLRISTAKGTAWLLSASEIEVLDLPGRAAHAYLGKLGPDPLDPATTVKAVLDHWAEARFSRRGVAALFLDQSFLAGVGNYLRSEILFLAGVSPHGKLPADRTALAQASLDLFRRSYATRGLTNSEDLVTALKSQGLRRRDYRHWVFSREVKACHVCGKTILKETLAGRRLYWCPGCQS